MVKLDKITDKVKTLKGENNLKWKKLKHDPKNIDCLHCQYIERENSIPKDKWTVKDAMGNDKIVNKIRILRGSHDDVIGWSV